MNGDWSEAVHLWLDSIELEPTNGFSYRRLWLCLPRCLMPTVSRE